MLRIRSGLRNNVHTLTTSPRACHGVWFKWHRLSCFANQIAEQVRDDEDLKWTP